MKKREGSQIIIVKVGTSSLTNNSDSLSRRRMVDITRQIAALHEEGHKMILVTSGAVAAGNELFKIPKTKRTVLTKQMLASVGQTRLMEIWSGLFKIYEIVVGQVLLTRSDFSDQQHYLNARDTLLELLKFRIIPIINENDVISIDEIKIGDNDNLSAHVANLIGASQLILLTDQPGLFTSDPRIHPDAELISVVEKIDDKIFSLAGNSGSTLGTGGMSTKIQAAQLATHSGVQTIIASAHTPDVLIKIEAGEKIGTLFKEILTPKKSWKRWLLSKKTQGIVILDGGASKSLLEHGSSLLAIGIKQVHGTFERGAIIQLKTENNETVGVGLANYSSQEIQQLMGNKSNKFQEILGFTMGDEIIHRDDMVLL